MLRSALVVTLVGGSCGGILACIFMTDLSFYVAAMVWTVSLLCVCACYVFRLVQIYCCTTTWHLPEEEEENVQQDDDEGNVAETDALRQPRTTSTTNASSSGARSLTRLVVSLVFAVVAAIICIAFVTMISSDASYASSEKAISSARGLAICLGMGTLSSIAMLGFLLEIWASGLLSCGCCPRVISVPMYLLPKNITIALFAVWGAVGCIIGAVCRALVVHHGLLWCSNNIEVPTAAGFAAGSVAGLLIWGYGTFVFLPDFKTSCSPLQRDAYFGVAEAIQHQENLDGIGDDAL
ncbi:membrane-associated protein, putative [Bodo saltans]|uniref:Membrane-associated protein, putative n=1 Tax=Bodo saltans TaxID=75058 RepID=A0A0S4KFG6_BODSA|nr:membrane-associated protein, putative [Bodo saltans]|eukprot:CUI14426.1 membrane-associated protein, putative [Bodo saltans]